MIPSDATFKIMALAKERAAATEAGGLEKKLNDMTSYGQTAGTSAASFALSHVPFVGPVLAKAFDLAASYGISELYKKLTDESTSNKDRITNTLHLLERSLAASTRQAYNTADVCAGKPTRECKDCQDAYREAYSVALLNESINELDAAQNILTVLADALTNERSRLRALAQRRENSLRSDIDDFREEHKNSSCIGMNRCYWINIPSPFKVIGNDQL
jgi:hypothetical protein